VVLRVDEKSQVQALERSAPVLMLMPGLPNARPTGQNPLLRAATLHPASHPMSYISGLFKKHVSQSVGRSIQRYICAVVLASALGLAGCGGSGDQAPLSKKQFVRRGQAICHRGYLRQQRSIEAFAGRHGFDYREPTQAQRERMDTAVVIPFVRRKIRQLDALAVPKGDDDQVREILQSMERGIRESEEHPERLVAPTAAHPEPFQLTRELASAYGIWLCGQA
jgi:hypothetical protein